MLEELRIQNFAVIDRLELQFSAGFTCITGETGAGKSILIDAVELLLGARADPDYVRAGGDRSLIEGVIKLDPRTRLNIMTLLQREDLIDADNPDYLTLMRELRRRGRSTARINGIPVRSELLTQVGANSSISTGRAATSRCFEPVTTSTCLIATLICWICARGWRCWSAS